MNASCRRWAVVLLWICAFVVGASAQENQTYILHTVERGQSLYSISRAYGVSEADIVALNPGSEVKILAGQTLKIPITQAGGPKFHTIKAGETLYRLCQIYNVSAKALCDANPGLSARNFKVGQVVLIPSTQVAPEAPAEESTPAEEPEDKCKTTHKVKRKETVYSICRQYGISEKQLLAANPQLKGKSNIKKGDELCIPYPAKKPSGQSTAPQRTPTDAELWSEGRQPAASHLPAIRAAVILPLLPEDAGAGQSPRMVEYYEGLLLAVDSLKRTGTSIDLYTYSVQPGVSALGKILTREEMKTMNVIFGPLRQEHIATLADFAKQHNARLVVPFTSKDNTVYNNPAVYQINTPQSYLYSEVYDHFTRTFTPENRIIFVEAEEGTAEKAEYIRGLKAELSTRSYATATVSENMTADEILLACDTTRLNVFIPTSGSNLTLIKLLPQLTVLKRGHESFEVSLFGYPEWQTYTADHIDSFFELDAYFYSSFYTNDLFPAARHFTRNYRHWYGKDMDDRYPRYGMLGFDTGYYFLKGLSLYGDQLEEKLDLMKVTPIQTGFKFQRVNNWGGFINRKVFFVHFGRDYELSKLDFD